MTPTGLIARSRHKVRASRFVGDLERHALESIAAADWILDTDQLAVAALVALARKADRALLDELTRETSRTQQMFDTVETKEESVDGTWVYLMVNLGLQASTLGLTPEGRKKLNLDTAQEETDALADAIALHSA